MDAPIRSAEEFAAALDAVANRYMMHLEPSAAPQNYSVKMDMTGTLLNITFYKAPGRAPYIAFTLHPTPHRRPTATRADFSGGSRVRV